MNVCHRSSQVEHRLPIAAVPPPVFDGSVQASYPQTLTTLFIALAADKYSSEFGSGRAIKFPLLLPQQWRYMTKYLFFSAAELAQPGGYFLRGRRRWLGWFKSASARP